jgi:hypothetical protein
MGIASKQGIERYCKDLDLRLQNTPGAASRPRRVGVYIILYLYFGLSARAAGRGRYILYDCDAMLSLSRVVNCVYGRFLGAHESKATLSTTVRDTQRMCCCCARFTFYSRLREATPHQATRTYRLQYCMVRSSGHQLIAHCTFMYSTVL